MKLTPDFFQAGVGVHDGVVQSGLRRLSPDFHFGLSSKSYDQMTSNLVFPKILNHKFMFFFLSFLRS